MNAGGMWCGAPALVVVVLKFALRSSTLNFSAFLSMTSYAEQTTMMSSLCNLHCLKARLKLKCNKTQWRSSLNLVSQQLKLCNIYFRNGVSVSDDACGCMLIYDI